MNKTGWELVTKNKVKLVCNGYFCDRFPFKVLWHIITVLGGLVVGNIFRIGIWSIIAHSDDVNLIEGTCNDTRSLLQYYISFHLKEYVTFLVDWFDFLKNLSFLWIRIMLDSLTIRKILVNKEAYNIYV